MKFPIRNLLPLLCLTATAAWAEVTVQQLSDRVRLELDGKLFTELRYNDSPHVYYWPIIGPGAAKMTRSWPLEEVPNEEHDHPHHRSMWFAHGLVNGFDFWSEKAAFGNRPPKHPLGEVHVDKVLVAKGGKDSGEVVTSQIWKGSDGSVPITATQRLVLYSTPDTERLFDFENVLKAEGQDAVFGETKEGMAAIRIAETMRLKQPKNKPGEGHIFNSEGLQDGDVWGKKAAWVAMTGPIDGKPYTIVMFDHPTNPRHPTRWHARDYGLFAANPFGGSQMDKSEPKDSGNLTLPAGQTFSFKYRVIIAAGQLDAAEIAKRYASYISK